MQKKTFCEMLMTIGILIMMSWFIVGIVITAIGGNNWELMKESPKLVVAFWIDQLIIWSGLFLTVGSAVAWNILDKKSQ